MKRSRINAKIEQNYFSANTFNVSNLTPPGDNSSFTLVDDTYLYQDVGIDGENMYGLYKIHQLIHSEQSLHGNTRFSVVTTQFEDVTIHPNSILNVSINLPLRNDNATDWGGAYIELLYRINGGINVTLGNSGHDGVMIKGRGATLTYNNNFLITPNTAPANTNYHFGLVLRLHSFDIDALSVDPKPLYLNSNHDINTIDYGGNTYPSFGTANNFNASFIILEYNRME